jgi:hypothetical protein
MDGGAHTRVSLRILDFELAEPTESIRPVPNLGARCLPFEQLRRSAKPLHRNESERMPQPCQVHAAGPMFSYFRNVHRRHGRMDAASALSFSARIKQSETVVCASFADLITRARLRS